MTRAFLAAPVVAVALAAACSGPVQVSDAFSSTGEVISLSGGSGGATNACASCHGLKGEGNGNLTPRLAGLDQGYILRQIGFYAEGQRINPQMVAVAKALTDEEREKVAAYYAQLPAPSRRACPAPPSNSAPPSTAGMLYRAGDPSRGIPSCASCHGNAGEGNAGNPPLAGQPAPYLERQIGAWRKGDRYGDALDIMTRIAKALSPGESRALSAYAARLPGGPGYPGPPEECPPARRVSPRNGV